MNKINKLQEFAYLNFTEKFLTIIDYQHENTHETREHSERLQKVALRFGKALGLSDNELNKLYLLAKLHDIGKIGIPIEILNKPGPLTEDEWDIVRMHPEIGCRIIQSFYKSATIGEEVMAHHERWDGTGYPKGLCGKDIPFLARIIAIADAYDVITHKRPYKKERSHAEALKEILRCSGSQFDPNLVEVFINAFHEDISD